MPSPHPVFSHFPPYTGEVPAKYYCDFLGAKIRGEFVAGMYVVPADGPNYNHTPAFDEDYFEYIDVLESVAAARGSYTMVELGAGFGRWVVRATLAVRQLHGDMPCRVVAVEAEPAMHQWMHQHFRDNGIVPEKHQLLHGVATEQPGDVAFCIGGMPGSPNDLKLNEWYGQCVMSPDSLAGSPEPDGEYCGLPATRHASGWRSVPVRGITLASILVKEEQVDLLDMDIEGQELPTIRSTIEMLDAKVKRMHIGTHSTEIEAGLRQLLAAHGWECQADYPLLKTSETPWGPMDFQNGVQSWVNPRLANRA